MKEEGIHLHFGSERTNRGVKKKEGLNLALQKPKLKRGGKKCAVSGESLWTGKGGKRRFHAHKGNEKGEKPEKEHRLGLREAGRSGLSAKGKEMGLADFRRGPRRGRGRNSHLKRRSSFIAGRQ